MVYRLITKQKCHFLLFLPSVNTRLRRNLINEEYHVQTVCIPIVTERYSLSIKSYQYRSKRIMNVIMEFKFNKPS